MSSVTVLILDLTALSLGVLLAFLSFIGYRKNGEMSYAYAAGGFAALGLSAVAGSVLTVFTSTTVAEHISSTAMILGFGLVIYGGEMAE